MAVTQDPGNWEKFSEDRRARWVFSLASHFSAGSSLGGFGSGKDLGGDPGLTFTWVQAGERRPLQPPGSWVVCVGRSGSLKAEPVSLILDPGTQWDLSRCLGNN